MPFKYGPNTALVEGFIEMCRGLDERQRREVGGASRAHLPRFCADGALWHDAYQTALTAHARCARAIQLGEAWQDLVVGALDSRFVHASFPVLVALLVWEYLTIEQRCALWRPFAAIAPLPGERRAS